MEIVLNFILNEKPQTKYVKINSKARWYAISDANWLTISPSSGIGNSILKIEVSQNTTNQTRFAKVNIISKCLSSIDIEQRSLYVIKKVLHAPIIDGYASWDEWGDEWQILTSNSPLNTTSEITAKFQMAYDDRNLYLACQVASDGSTDSTHAEPVNRLINDGIALFVKIDSTSSSDGNYETDGAYMLSMRKNCKYPNHFKWWHSNSFYGSNQIFKNDTNFKIAQVDDYGVWGDWNPMYTQEWQIPWIDIVNNMNKWKAKFIKIEIVVVENKPESKNTPVQQLFWRNSSGREWYDTRTFAVAALAGIPNTPQNLIATLNNNVALLQWDKISEESFFGYRIYQSKSSGDYILIDSVMNDISLTTKIIGNLESNNSYVFRVSALNKYNVESDLSNVALVVLPILEIKKIDKPPQLDGLISSNDLWLSSWNNLTANVNRNRTFNMTARFQLQYDDDNLYLICQQIDNNTVDTSLNPNTYAYLNDCFEVFLKLGAENAPEGRYIEGTYQFRMRRASVFPYHFDGDHNESRFAVYPNFKITQSDDGNSFIQEWQMPWKALEDGTVIWDGLYLRFELQATDNTTGTKEGRTQQLFWRNNSDVQYMDTRSFSIVELESRLSGHTNIKNMFRKIDNICLYPNPATNIIQFKSPISSLQPCYLQLYDYTGRLILTQPQPDMHQGEEVSIDLSTQSEGLYLIKIQSGKKEYYGKVLLVK